MNHSEKMNYNRHLELGGEMITQNPNAEYLTDKSVGKVMEVIEEDDEVIQEHLNFRLNE